MKEITVMGWDAAWTPQGTGAWAVCRHQKVAVLEVCPKGDALIERLRAQIRAWRPDLIAMDFPLAAGGVRGWRQADLLTTRAFSAFGCPVHSPTPERPGAWGDRIVAVLEEEGYHFSCQRPVKGPSFVEVYPHTVNLHLNRIRYRLPYKVGRSAKYWPGTSVKTRARNLHKIHQSLWQRLQEIYQVPEIPEATGIRTLAGLKPLEDQLDALLCVYAAHQILEGRFQPYGDTTAAIWNPDHQEIQNYSNNHLSNAAKWCITSAPYCGVEQPGSSSGS